MSEEIESGNPAGHGAEELEQPRPPDAPAEAGAAGPSGDPPPPAEPPPVREEEPPVEEPPAETPPVADPPARPEPTPAETAAPAPAPAAAPPPAPVGISASELQAAQAAEEAKGDPALDDVEAASIEVRETEREEPFEKLAAKAKKYSPERVRAVAEALLFLSEKPLTPEEVRAATGIELPRIHKAFDELSGHYREGVSGIVLYAVAGGWQFRSSPDVSEHARRFLKVKPQRLTRAALETLAIVAYRQPVTRPEIEEIRGVDCGAVVKALLERKLIKILGKKEEPGRPILYGTTREFLEFFALKDLASLPTLREFHELSEEHREIVEKEAPPEPAAGVAGLVSELADPALRAALEARQSEGEEALDELERAIESADARSRAAQQALEPQPPAPEPPPQAPAPAAAPAASEPERTPEA